MRPTILAKLRMPSVVDRFVELRGLRFHYRDWESRGGAAQTLVLVHGLGSSAHIWDFVAPLLAPDLRLLAPDQRGHGLTDQPEDGYGFETVSEDLCALLAAVAPTARLVLVGHSWGASVVLHAAALRPEQVEGIVLVDGGIGSPGERWTWQETLARLTPPEIDGLPYTQLVERWRSGGVAAGDPRLETFFRSLFHVDSDGRIRRRFRVPNHLKVVRALWEHRPVDLLREVRCPVLVLPARQENDPLEMRLAKESGAERATAVQPLARVRWFDDTIHDVPLQRPDELAAELRAFSLGLEGRRD